jgi:polyisoprenyl-teichoic acid--peptidoglycan teichoic acid transferase
VSEDQEKRDGKSLPESKKDGVDTAIPGEEIKKIAAGEAEETLQSQDAGGSDELAELSDQDDKKHLSGRLKRMLCIVGLVLAFLLVAAGIWLFVFYKQIQETERVILDEVTSDLASYDRVVTVEQEETDLNEIYTVFPEHIVNIGLLGFDRGWDREGRGHYMFRPDVVALISIDFEQDEISVIRILRDSYVPVHDSGGFHDKMNHAYAYGYYTGDGEDQHADGIYTTLLTMSDVLGGIPIHYYVSVDMYSVIALVDALGGIYYDVEEEIVDEVWIFGVLLPPIEPGPQLLDGTDYMRYLQYRDSKSNQEYGRIERQENLLRETYHYLREKGRLTDIPLIYNIYRDYVDTDLSYKKIAALANYALKTDLTDQNMHFYSLGGTGQMKDGVYYEIISQEERLEIIETVFGISVEPWAPIVLEDSPEYLEEQERIRRLEEREGLGPLFFDFEEMKLFED